MEETYKRQVTFKLTKILSTKDDIGDAECDMCNKSCWKANETWYEGELEGIIIFICEECFNKFEEK